MKKSKIIILCIIFAVAAIAALVFYIKKPIEEANVVIESNEPVFTEEAYSYKRRIIMGVNKSGYIFNDKLYDDNKVFTYTDENGFCYYPLEPISNIYNAEVKYIKDYPVIIVTNENGIKSYIVIDANYSVVGKDIIFSNKKAIVKDNICYVDRDLISKIFGIEIRTNYDYGLTIFNSVTLDSDDINNAVRIWNIPNPEHIKKLTEASEASGKDYAYIQKLSYMGKLYYSNEKEKLTQLQLNDNGIIIEAEIKDSPPYKSNTYYLEGEDGDNSFYECSFGNTNMCGLNIGALRDESVNNLKKEYLYYKYSNDVLNIENINKLTEIKNSINNKEIVSVNDYNININVNSKTQWHNLCSKAKAGDIFLCHKSNNAEYGYNNHSGIILEVLDNDTLHILHARNAEYGIGSDNNELDFVNYQKFYENDYWKKTEQMAIYSLKDINQAQIKELINNSSIIFKGYEFGYYNILGEKQLTCAELVQILYESIDIELWKTRDMRINSLFNNDLYGAVILPDELMMSDKLLLKEIWVKN